MEHSRNIRLELQYDGTDYCGWQYLPDQMTLQGVVQDTLLNILKEEVIVEGAGRTDSGVHALAYTANFITHNTKIPPDKFTTLLNRHLPPAIRVKKSVQTELDFHSGLSCLAREYFYFMWNEKEIPPFFQRYAGHDFRPVHIDKIQECISLFVGRHDFQSFCSAYPPGFDHHRVIYHFRADRVGPRIYYFIKGAGFLHGMIRDLVSLSIQYSLGNVTLEEIKAALRSERMLAAGLRTRAPACGLYFKRAYYPSLSRQV